MSVSIYEKLLERKRVWTPVRPTKGTVKNGAEAAISRALALRSLELPVGEFIKQATSKDVPTESINLLRSNVQDEIRHDLALGYAAEVYGIDEKTEREAAQLTKAWVEHPDHTVLKAMVLERSVFFVLLPFFRFNGDAGLRTVSADISRDEQVHVATNTLICKELSLKVSKSLDTLRKATIQWVVESLGKSEDKFLDREFWIKQSDSLLYSGKAEGLTETKRPRMLAFFEHNNKDLPKYV